MLARLGLLAGSALWALSLGACSDGESGDPADAARKSWEESRADLLRRMAENGVTDERVLDAFRQVPRHEFIHPRHREDAYLDVPLPIGGGQTISQPSVVGLMTQAVELAPGERVLEIGTGSGYQAAILSKVAREVFTIEIVESLAESARERLARLGYANVEVKGGDGYRGWPEKAPFDAIVVTAAPDHVPPALVEQLAPGGRMVLPVGAPGVDQELVLIEKDADGKVTQRMLLPVRFVPMTGEAQSSGSNGGDR